MFWPLRSTVKTMKRPSGDQVGKEWYPGPEVISSAIPVSGSTRQMEPDIATAMLFPSGDQAGAQGVLLGAGGK